MKKIILLPIVLCIAACAAQDPNKPWTVQNGSPCPKEGMTARDTDGDVSRCVEVPE